MSQGFRVVDAFFDREKVIKAMDDGTRRALSHVGAFIRTRARSSMKRPSKKRISSGQGSSPPGKPPSVHEGSLKDKLYFAYDAATKSVVTGPVKYKRGIVPALLEFGGSQTLVVHGVRKNGKTFETTIQAHYAGNPFMRPALEKELAAGTIPKEWGNGGLGI